MKALFDFEFKKFVTPSIIKIVYILIMVLLALGYIGLVISGFAQDAMMGLLFLVIVGPLMVLIYLVLARAGLESLIAQIRTAENTAELVRLAGGTPPSETANGQLPNDPTEPQGYSDPTTRLPSQSGPQDGPAGDSGNSAKNDGGDTPPANPYQK